jgi:hypothetical protein
MAHAHHHLGDNFAVHNEVHYSTDCAGVNGMSFFLAQLRERGLAVGEGENIHGA